MDLRQSTFEALAKLLGESGLAGHSIATAVGGLAASLASVASAAVSRRLNATAPIQIDGGTSADLSADRTISILSANASRNGYFSQGDYIKLATYPTLDPGTATNPICYIPAVGTMSFKTLEDFGVPTWGAWCAKVTIAGADTTKLLFSLDLTDTAKANKNYLLAIEFETLLDTTDTAHMGYHRVTQLFEAWYDGSGVPAFGILGSGTDSYDVDDHAGSPGIPTITAVTPSASGANIISTLTKPASSDDTFAQTRCRLATVKEAT